MTDTRVYEAGHVLSAVEALADGRELFTRSQVAQLIAMSFDSGRSVTHRANLADLYCTWEDHAERRSTYEQKVAARIAEMEEAGRMARLRAGQPERAPYMGGAVEWGDTDEPYDVLTRRDRDVIAAAEKIPPIGNQGEPGTREYAEGWRQMRATLTAWQWQTLTSGDHPPVGARTLAAIRDLDHADRTQGRRRLQLVKNSGGAA